MALKRILISAGHSTVEPKDPGATGNGFVEAQETLKMRDEVAKLLRTKILSAAAPIEVVEDGSDGINEPLRKAVGLAKRSEIAIEFHFNAAGSSKATGVEVLAKPNKKLLAQRIAT